MPSPLCKSFWGLDEVSHDPDSESSQERDSSPREPPEGPPPNVITDLGTSSSDEGIGHTRSTPSDKYKSKHAEPHEPICAPRATFPSGGPGHTYRSDSTSTSYLLPTTKQEGHKYLKGFTNVTETGEKGTYLTTGELATTVCKFALYLCAGIYLFRG
ncbi:hypothetical protein RSOLAG1IB_11094 [Rhizoctonia solani AG-1 IB]|uniref:Uncharacterized protein n=1 Tax=Thanatephorus cucumeris (strain AG1-IB / isolate 7/3/14) TaxID=1108050 RepID=A0A0B7F5D6_THACB|nr:hypothetical protein RSOLAG1IB_11094 [Rhizoctonia solani AG-1 IB]